MKSEIFPAVKAVTEYMPPKKDGFFEKSMKVAQMILEHEPVSILAHTVDGAIQTAGMVLERKYHVKALRYAVFVYMLREE